MFIPLKIKKIQYIFPIIYCFIRYFRGWELLLRRASESVGCRRGSSWGQHVDSLAQGSQRVKATPSPGNAWTEKMYHIFFVRIPGKNMLFPTLSSQAFALLQNSGENERENNVH